MASSTKWEKKIGSISMWWSSMYIEHATINGCWKGKVFRIMSWCCYQYLWLKEPQNFQIHTVDIVLAFCAEYSKNPQMEYKPAETSQRLSCVLLESKSCSAS